MVSLTQNRPDGGIRPPVHLGHLTSAFEDAILVPLASWLFLLLLLPALWLVTRHDRRARSFRDEGRSRRILRWHDYIKAFLALAVIAMACLEMARLAKLHYGIGLLPFTPVCMVIAITLNLCRHRTRLRGHALFSVVILYYSLLLVVESVKLNTLVRVEKGYPRTGSAYPANDQVLDLAALVGCLAVLIVFTLLDLFLG